MDPTNAHSNRTDDNNPKHVSNGAQGTNGRNFTSTKLKLAALALIGVTSVFPTLWGQFVFDDGEAILKNADVTSSSIDSFYNVFRNDFWGVRLAHPQSHKSYRPLTTLSFRWTYLQWGANPFVFHVTNLVFHGVNCVLVYWFLQKCFNWSARFASISYYAAVLFAAHPVHVEPLGAIVGRADLVSSLIFLGGYLLCPEGVSFSGSLAISMISIFGSLFKENAIVLVIFYVSMDIVVRSRFRLTRKQLSYHMLSLCLVASFVGWRLWYQGGPPSFQPFDNPAAFAKNKFCKVISMAYIWLLNIYVLINPMWLCYDWSMGCVSLIRGPFDLRFYIVVAALFLLIRFAWAAFNNRVIMTAAIIGATTFLPSSNILFTVGFVLAERNLYLPSIGFTLLLSYGVSKYGNMKVFSLILMWFYLRSIHRSVDWIEEGLLFSSALNVCPNNAKVHYNMATHYGETGKRDEAARFYKQALELRQDYYQAMNNYGNLLRTVEKFDEAEHWLRKAVEIKPDFAAAWMNLGIVISHKNPTEAMHCYSQALKYRKRYPDCEYNLGNLYLDMGKKEDALKAWMRAVSQKPTHAQAWINIVILFDQEGKLQEAKEWAVRASSILPSDDTLLFLLGNISGKLMEFEAGEAYFKNAIHTRNLKNVPMPAKYYANLGVLYHRWNKKDLARLYYEEALKLDSSMDSIRKNINSLL